MSITLRFVTVPGLTSDLIARGQLGVAFPTHVEALMPDGTLLGAHLRDGVQARPRDYDATTWYWQHYVQLPATDDQAAAFYQGLRSQVGKHYDSEGIAAMAAGALLGGIVRDWKAPDTWFCSELQAYELEQASIIGPLPVCASHVTPLMLYVACAAIVPAGIGPPETKAPLNGR